MQQISINKILAEKVPGIQLSCIESDVVVKPLDTNLWNEILHKVSQLAENLKVEEISQIPAISATRKAYKLCGKDPARYRVSAEALLRRVVNRNEIYQINNVVDLLNLVSVTTGFSIGGYDAGKIKGPVEFGIGKPNEPYIGIGRGELNIENLPVFRDELGAFGSPTSDSERTSVTLETQRFLMIIIGYSFSNELTTATQFALDLLAKYANALHVKTKLINKNEDNL